MLSLLSISSLQVEVVVVAVKMTVSGLVEVVLAAIVQALGLQVAAHLLKQQSQ
jgi:hypothetical protein